MYEKHVEKYQQTTMEDLEKDDIWNIPQIKHFIDEDNDSTDSEDSFAQFVEQQFANKSIAKETTRKLLEDKEYNGPKDAKSLTETFDWLNDDL